MDVAFPTPERARATIAHARRTTTFAGSVLMPNNDQQNNNIRTPQPDAAAQDPHAADVQERVRADSEANRQQAARVRATTPNEVSEKTVAEIAAEAEARAKR
jgi:hypothetical protein